MFWVSAGIVGDGSCHLAVWTPMSICLSIYIYNAVRPNPNMHADWSYYTICSLKPSYIINLTLWNYKSINDNHMATLRRVQVRVSERFLQCQSHFSMLAKQMQISVHIQPVLRGMQLKALTGNDLLVSSQCYFIISHCLFKQFGATCFTNTSQLEHYKHIFIVGCIHPKLFYKYVPEKVDYKNNLICKNRCHCGLIFNSTNNNIHRIEEISTQLERKSQLAA